MDTELLEAIKTATPEMYRQTILWGLIDNGTLIVTMLLIITATVWGYRKLKPLAEQDDALVMLRVATGFFSGLWTIVLICGILQVVRILVAPYSYILSQIGT